MILDNLSIAGLLVAALYLLLPLLFGRETWRVDETATGREPEAAASGWDNTASPLPCGES